MAFAMDRDDFDEDEEVSYMFLSFCAVCVLMSSLVDHLRADLILNWVVTYTRCADRSAMYEACLDPFRKLLNLHD